MALYSDPAELRSGVRSFRPEAAARLPRFADAMVRADAARAQLRLTTERLRRDRPGTDQVKRADDALRRGLQAFADGRWDEAATVFQSWE